MDRDTLNCHELPESIESHSEGVHSKKDGAPAKSISNNENGCGEGTMEEDQPQRAGFTQTQQPAQKDGSDQVEYQQPEPSPSSASPPHPPIPSKKSYRCRICGTSYYAQSQTRGLCYICTTTLSL